MIKKANRLREFGDAAMTVRGASATVESTR
jgi:hypothetical protein